MKVKLYARLAGLIVARHNCIKHVSETKDTTERERAQEWKLKHEEAIIRLVKRYMPSGSGFDNGTTIDLNVSNKDRLVFDTSFHHMDENGFYDGWTEHCIRVYPAFDNVRMTITGQDKNNIKEYIYEVFDTALNTEVEY